MSPRTYDYDIVMMSDFRYPGGTSSSQVEEIKAQSAAGYRTGLLQVVSPRLNRERPFHGGIARCVEEGHAEVVTGGDRLRCRLLLIRHPVVLSVRRPLPCAIEADEILIVANQPPQDAAGGSAVYRVEEVHRIAIELLGPNVRWAPIGPLVRDAVLADGNVPVLESDWNNVIEPAEWTTDRVLSTAKPVLGRHSRPDPRKWPATASEILAAYPDSDEFEVRILGGAEPAKEVLGRIPESWTVHDFNALSARRFLRDVDFYVYFHHPVWVEAFGRSILEAMASGAVCILPRQFERLFEGACLYTDPAGVQGLVRALHADPALYARHSDTARRAVEARFSHRAHVERLTRLIGAPAGEPAPEPCPDVSPAETRRTILFVTSNGTGLGHVTRLMAMARRCSDSVRPVFLTLSQAVDAVRDQGFVTEYAPSSKALSTESAIWNPHFTTRLAQAIRLHEAAAVVFDGTMPYNGLIAAREQFPGIPFVWSRRGMWKPGVGDTALERARHFDLIVEPGDLSAPRDRTPPVPAGVSVRRVDPIVFGRRDEALSCEEARRDLGIPIDVTAVLIQLGSGNNLDTRALIQDLLSLLSEDPGVHVAIAESPIAERPLDDFPSVQRLRRYPLSPYYPAFDFAVSAAGYNSFHELIAFAVPTLFLPNPNMPTDDQVARAMHAHELGAALCVRSVDRAALRQALDRMREVDTREALVRRCQDLAWRNGAEAAMAAIEALLPISAGVMPAPPPPSAHAAKRHVERVERKLGELPGGRRMGRLARRLGDAATALTVSRRPRLPVPGGRHLDKPEEVDLVVTLVCLGQTPDALEALVEEVAAVQVVRRVFKPLFVIDHPIFPSLRRHGFVAEYLIPREAWHRDGHRSDWNRYVQERLGFIQEAYRPDRMVIVSGTGAEAAQSLWATLPAVG